MAMKKKTVLAVSVTTWEALIKCIADNASAFVIENPLYAEIFQNKEGEESLFNMTLKFCGKNRSSCAEKCREKGNLTGNGMLCTIFLWNGRTGIHKNSAAGIRCAVTIYVS